MAPKQNGRFIEASLKACHLAVTVAVISVAIMAVNVLLSSNLCRDIDSMAASRYPIVAVFDHLHTEPLLVMAAFLHPLLMELVVMEVLPLHLLTDRLAVILANIGRVRGISRISLAPCRDMAGLVDRLALRVEGMGIIMDLAHWVTLIGADVDLTHAEI